MYSEEEDVLPRSGVLLLNVRAIDAVESGAFWFLSARTQFAHTKDGLADFMAAEGGFDAMRTATFVW